MGMGAKPPRLPILLAVLTAAAPALLRSQSDTSARLAGTAASAFNGRALSGVMIAVPAVRQFAVTDSTGTFVLAGLPVGRQKVRIAYQGRETAEYEFDLRRGKTKRLAVVLDVAVEDLAPVVVEARYPDTWRDLAGFYERRKLYGGFARFYTREDIERWRPQKISQLLAQQGIFTRCVTQGCVPTRHAWGSLCVVPVTVDGMPFWADAYDDILIDEVAGVEVYRSDLTGLGWGGLRGSSGTFGHGSLFQLPSCGAIRIWTR